MTAQWHRALTAILASLTGVAGLLSATDTTTLGLSPTVAAWTGVVLAVATIVVTAIRQSFDSAPAGP